MNINTTIQPNSVQYTLKKIKGLNQGDNDKKLCNQNVKIIYNRKHFRSSKVEISLSNPNIQFTGKTKGVFTIQNESTIENILFFKGNLSINGEPVQINKKGPISLNNLIRQYETKNADQYKDPIETNRSKRQGDNPNSSQQTPMPDISKPIINQPSVNSSNTENTESVSITSYTTESVSRTTSVSITS